MNEILAWTLGISGFLLLSFLLTLVIFSAFYDQIFNSTVKTVKYIARARTKRSGND